MSCVVEGCDRPRKYKKLGVCDAHYKAHTRTNPEAPECTVDACLRPASVKGLCDMHYQRQWKTGSTGDALPRRQQRSPEHTTRTCDLCGQEKTEDEVYPNMWRRSGRRAWCKVCTRVYNLARIAEVDPRSAVEWFIAQDKKCQICGTAEDLTIDHCHATGTLRGLLCRQHNTLLGMAADDPEILENAIKYLARFSC